HLPIFVALTVAVAVAGATLDIVVDAYRVEIAPAQDQGALVATYSLGYRIALIVSGALALVLADHLPWPWVYRGMAACFLVPLLACAFAREPSLSRARSQTWAQGLHEGVVAPFVDVFKRFGNPTAWALIVFILGIKISDQALVGGIIGPFYLDQGFSKTEIAAVTKVYGIWVGIAGTFLGGIAVARWGLLWPLLIAIVLGAASNLLYLSLIGANGDLTRLTLVISGENLAQGFLGTAAVAYLSALVNQRYTATQYALFSSLIMLPGKVLGFYSGAIVEASAGYGPYFVLSAALALPAVALFFWLKPRVRLPDARADDRHPIQS
ncbi:MAG: MFS transporter, partial [Xanthomonadales bacterium]|nr:MFS transporter [Xanthomonadales bacterium]